MNKIKKTVLIIFGIILSLGLLVFFLPDLLGLFAQDIASINDQDLMVEKEDIIPQEENAYYDLIKIKEVSYPVDYALLMDHIKGKTWDESFVEEALSKSEKTLEYFDQAIQRQKFQDPIFVEFLEQEEYSADLTLTSMGSWREAARLSSLKALYLLKKGKEIEALDEAMKSVKIGQKIQDSRDFLITYLFAIAIKNQGLETMQKIVTSTDLPSESLLQYVQEIEKSKRDKEWIRTALKEGYLSQTRTIDWMSNGEIKFFKGYFLYNEDISGKVYYKTLDRMAESDFFFQPNKTKSLLADWARLELGNIEKPCGFQDDIQTESLMVLSSKDLFKENFIGKMLYDLIAVSLNGGLNNKGCESGLLFSTTQLLFALKAYQIETGSFPLSLEELVPKYISSIPKDPFDGENIRYSAEKGIIYSVGLDAIDSGGSEGDDWREMEDPTFRFIEEETVDWQTYKNEEYGFEIEYPGQWVIEGDSLYYPFSVLLMPSEFQKDKRSMMLKINPVNVGTDSPFDLGVELESQIIDTKFAGRLAKEYIVDSVSHYSRYIKIIDLEGINWEEANEISFFLKKEYKDLASTYNKILSTFKFLE